MFLIISYSGWVVHLVKYNRKLRPSFLPLASACSWKVYRQREKPATLILLIKLRKICTFLVSELFSSPTDGSASSVTFPAGAVFQWWVAVTGAQPSTSVTGFWHTGGDQPAQTSTQSPSQLPAHFNHIQTKLNHFLSINRVFCIGWLSSPTFSSRCSFQEHHHDQPQHRSY